MNPDHASERTSSSRLRCLPPPLLCDKTPRVGSGAALAQDAVDLADRLALDRFAIVGHDWCARAAYTVAALFPERVASHQPT